MCAIQVEVLQGMHYIPLYLRFCVPKPQFLDSCGAHNPYYLVKCEGIRRGPIHVVCMHRELRGEIHAQVVCEKGVCMVHMGTYTHSRYPLETPTL